eukprot:4095488-Lingulodinium_polyedra.AAC.1
MGNPENAQIPPQNKLTRNEQRAQKRAGRAKRSRRANGATRVQRAKPHANWARREHARNPRGK